MLDLYFEYIRVLFKCWHSGTRRPVQRMSQRMDAEWPGQQNISITDKIKIYDNIHDAKMLKKYDYQSWIKISMSSTLFGLRNAFNMCTDSGPVAQ